MISPKAREHP